MIVSFLLVNRSGTTLGWRRKRTGTASRRTRRYLADRELISKPTAARPCWCWAESTKPTKACTGAGSISASRPPAMCSCNSSLSVSCVLFFLFSSKNKKRNDCSWRQFQWPNRILHVQICKSACVVSCYSTVNRSLTIHRLRHQLSLTIIYIFFFFKKKYQVLPHNVLQMVFWPCL